VIRRVPDLIDVRFMGEILTSLGRGFSLREGTLTIHAERLRGWVITI
jgi:UDP-N-acetylglucosamine enolpyruvyl transferase